MVIEQLRLQQHRSSTLHNYYTIWKIFNQFFVKLDVKPRNWEDRITLFTGYLVQNGRKSTTIRSYISALKAELKMNKIKVSTDDYLLASLMKACRLRNHKVITKFPIQKPMLHVMIDKVSILFGSQPYLKCLYQAILITTYYRLFRIGEVTGRSHPIKARDFHIAMNKRKLLFVLHMSKTHGLQNNPQIIKIVSTSLHSTHSHHCLFEILRHYLRVRSSYKNNNEIFFVFRDHSPVKPNHLRTVLQKLLKMMRLKPWLYSAHCLRLVRACEIK